MKRIHIMVFITACFISSFLLFGCGGNGPGAPGSCGSEDTGVIIQLESASHSDPAGDQGDMWQIDLYMDLCDAEYEEWGDDHLHISFSSTPIYTTELDNTLYLTNYRVTYTPLSPDNPPIDEISGGAQGAISVDPLFIAGPFNFLILDANRKIEIQDLLARGVYQVGDPMLYNMTVEFYGQDKYGNDFCVPYIRTVEIGPYDKCD